MFKILAKANKMLAFLKRKYAKDLKADTFKLLYMSLVRSNLSYCSQVWAPQSSINQLILVERLQRRATKYMCKHSELSYKKRFTY